MVPGFAITGTGTQIEFDFDGPFTVPLDPGYLPWESTQNLPPTLQLTSAGTEFIQGQSVEMSAVASDPEQGDLSTSVVWNSSLDGSLGTGATRSPILSVGNHTITATATDGFNVTATQTLTLMVRTIPNNRPQVSISAPVESQVAVGASVTLSATATDAEDGNLSSTIAWSSDKNGALGTGASLSISTLSAGMHVLTASSTDLAGAKGVARTTLLVGNPTPIASYAYNALGQRVKKTDESSDATTHFIYDPEGKLIAEIDAATGDTIREYIYVNGQQVAIVDDTQTQNEEIYFMHNDHLGTPQKITDGTQQVVWAADYEPFGKGVVTKSDIGSNVRFPGQYENEESGLHYNYFRDYDPETGRYVQSDPIGLIGGLNTYSYVSSNPMRSFDSQGLWSPGAHDAILEHAFGEGLDKSDVARLQKSSRDFDRRTQSSEQSHMHSMVRSGGQYVIEAIRLRDGFIKDTLEDARRLARAGDRDAALDRLGEACHAIMDSSSPMHRDENGQPRVWNPAWPFGHSPNDHIGNETVNDLTPEILEEQKMRLNDAYDSVFGQRSEPYD